METSIISISNLKGGTSKTTSAVNVSAALGLMGYKVLVVDCDPLMNLTTSLVREYNPERSLLRTLEQKLPLEQVVIPTTCENVSIITGHQNLVAYAMLQEPLPHRYKLFAHLLNTDAIKEYRFVIFDNSITRNCILASSLLASDYFLIPLEAKTFSKNGLRDVFTYAYSLEPDSLECLGCFIANYLAVPAQERMEAQIAQITKAAEIPLLGVPIPFSRVIESAVQQTTSIYGALAPRATENTDLRGALHERYGYNPTAEAYLILAEEIAGRARGKERGFKPIAKAASANTLAILSSDDLGDDFTI